MRVVFVDCTPELRDLMVRRNLAIPDNIRVFDKNPSNDDLIDLTGDAEIVLVEHTVIPNQILRSSAALKAIVFMGTGAGTYVDLEEAERLGIHVRATPGYGNKAVAEHAMALMFTAARDIVRMDRDLRDNIWDPRKGRQLSGSKVGVIGLGEVGGTFASMALALGMKVVGWNRSSRDLPYFDPHIENAFWDADFISLHLGLNEHTRGIVDERLLGMAKPGFIFVNTARAELVTEHLMLEALYSGQIGYAALDVYPTEPLPYDSPLLTAPNVTLAAHAAYRTDQAYEELWRLTMVQLEVHSATLSPRRASICKRSD
ncbi:NAD(P)-dependent oxidoreductase [Mesorhizobium calcicola]|uniref:NAD(P)-dependent oxidoreductase n=1 Tax=Mesorhizobium calcicola TaxID=1300310 RepID=A0ABW4W7C8_9HYPH